MRRKDYFVLTGRVSVLRKKILDYGFLSSFLLVPILKNSVLSSFNIRLSEIIHLLSITDTVSHRLDGSELVGGGAQRSETVCACR